MTQWTISPSLNYASERSHLWEEENLNLQLIVHFFNGDFEQHVIISLSLQADAAKYFQEVWLDDNTTGISWS